MGAIVGFVTALLTLYAKYLDVKKTTRDLGATGASVTPAEASAPTPAQPPDWRRPLPDAVSPPAPDSAAVARGLQTVRAPALALLTAGALSLVSDLFMAGFAYVDEFVTPLTTQTAQRRAFEAAHNGQLGPVGGRLEPPVPVTMSDQTSVALAIITFLSFALASAMTVWAAYGMLRLRSYWLSVAGSVAIMPGACFCCLAGFPVGIWSLMVLLRPEIMASFR
jgi:hypothetical protein